MGIWSGLIWEEKWSDLWPLLTVLPWQKFTTTTSSTPQSLLRQVPKSTNKYQKVSKRLLLSWQKSTTTTVLHKSSSISSINAPRSENKELHTPNFVPNFLEEIFDCLKLIKGGSSHRGGDEEESGGETWLLFIILEKYNKKIISKNF